MLRTVRSEIIKVKKNNKKSFNRTVQSDKNFFKKKKGNKSLF